MSSSLDRGATGLVDLLDGLLDTGVAASGEITLALAGIDLVHVELRAFLASAEAKRRAGEGKTRGRREWIAPPRRRPPVEAVPSRIDADSDSWQTGLARLVLVLAEVIRELMERQALRRMQAGSLAESEVRRLSVAFSELDERLDRLYSDLVADPKADLPELLGGIQARVP
ncbi:MAG TPA: gas vesicle protein K [Gaiellaceae bacterium]